MGMEKKQICNFFAHMINKKIFYNVTWEIYNIKFKGYPGCIYKRLEIHSSMVYIWMGLKEERKADRVVSGTMHA